MLIPNVVIVMAILDRQERLTPPKKRPSRRGAVQWTSSGQRYSTVMELFPTGVSAFPGGPRIGSATNLLVDPFFSL